MPLPRKVVALGNCLEIGFTDGRIYQPTRSLLCCSVSGKTLWIFPDTGKWAADNGGSAHHQLYAKWSKFEADKSKKLRISEAGKLKSFGQVDYIIYSSDKWCPKRKKTRYIHHFSRRKPPTLRSNSTKNPSFCKINGGNIDVKSVGITG